MDLPPEATDRVFGDSMLEMELLQLGGQLSGTLAYNTGLFKQSTVERVASQYQVCKVPQLCGPSTLLHHDIDQASRYCYVDPSC